MNSDEIVKLLPTEITIVEVGPRDGLQNESAFKTHDIKNTGYKIDLINALSKTGVKHIETGAFVSAKKIPQMADSSEVFEKITRQASVKYSALTPNLKGVELAIKSSVNEIAIFTSSSETFCKKNINCSIRESLNRFEPVIERAKQVNIPVRAYLSCIIDCPYDGPTNRKQVADISKELIEMGCYQVSLGDTIGTGTPLRIAQMLEAVLLNIPTDKLAIHLHDTYGQALANLYQVLQMGITTVDTSIAGLGGCPYAIGATGNLATEDVLYLCSELGINTGIDLNQYIKIGHQFCKKTGIINNSKVSIAKRNLL